MKTSTIEVGELVSTLSAAGVHRQLSTLPGVRHADVNYVAGSATVHYDEAKITLDAIRQRVVDCGYPCCGELVPAHVCDPPDHKVGGEAHAGHAMPAGATGKSTSAAPMAIMVGTGLGAMNGILFKNASALENATRLTVIVFDKTGTLTVGQPDVVEMVTAPGVSEAQLLAAAAAVEKFSEHPLAQAVLKRAGATPVEVATGFTNIDGQGARAMVGADAVLLGNRKLMQSENVSAESMAALAADATRLEGGGRTVVHVARAGQLIGLIAIADAVRPTSKATIAKLQERGVKVAMMTGDNQATAERIGKELGIDIVLAEVLPGQKADTIKALQDQGNKVGMVGDGINDAPALTQADVGFAIGAGTDVAMESAQVVLMKSDPYDVVGAIELSRATLRKMHQNLWWAVGYNVIAFPVAAGVFYPFTLSPELAALSMSGSSAVVAINALMLKRTRLAGIKSARVAGPPVGATTTRAGAT